MRLCKRCGVEIAANMNRRYCLDCRKVRDHQSHVKVNRKAGCEAVRCRPYPVWMQDYLKHDKVDTKIKVHLDRMYTHSWDV